MRFNLTLSIQALGSVSRTLSTPKPGQSIGLLRSCFLPAPAAVSATPPRRVPPGRARMRRVCQLRVMAGPFPLRARERRVHLSVEPTFPNLRARTQLAHQPRRFPNLLAPSHLLGCSPPRHITKDRNCRHPPTSSLNGQH